jgi:hypothetical protein
MEEVERDRQHEASANQEATDRLHAVVTNLQPSLMDALASLHSGLDLLRQRTSKLPEGESGGCDDLIERLHGEVKMLENTMKTFLELYAFASSHHSYLQRIDELLKSAKELRRG